MNMLRKEELASRREQYEVEMFREEGWVRRKCAKCGKYFWTIDPDRNDCGEPPCAEYSFIGNPPIRKMDWNEVREKFLSFFERRGHERVSRYPVVARWRDDVLFTGASIMCFQPWVTSGEVDPPANPLVISQPCVRFPDLDNVGKTGRHFTMFEMMAHHAFNNVYFKDETVRLGFEWLKSIGVKEDDIVFKEDWWEGGGNAGPDHEVIVRGLELATLVHMAYEGPVNGRYLEMKNKVVDTGYGLNRHVWISKGSPTGYDAMFPKLLKYLRAESGLDFPSDLISEYTKVAGKYDLSGGRSNRTKVIEEVSLRLDMDPKEVEMEVTPQEMVYAISDHTRAIIFMLGDGVVPSNAREGYLARLLIRRSIRLLKSLGIEDLLIEIISKRISEVKDPFPEMLDMEDEIIEMISHEQKKYYATIKKGREIVKRLYSKKGKITREDLEKLYDSHGLLPEEVMEFTGKKIDVPEDFLSKIAEKHSSSSREGQEQTRSKKVDLDVKKYPKTELLYYTDPYLKEVNALVIDVLPSENEGSVLILDRTIFYPEGGGQEADTGKINGRKVKHVEKVGGVVLHLVEGKFSPGEVVKCQLDWGRRIQLMRHHTATHILLGALRRKFGKHIWQAGAHKSENYARLDVTHYLPLNKDEIREIEDSCNRVIMENREVRTTWMERNEAERKYGFVLYQGGAVPGRKIRVVEIEDWDIEACGGTHVHRTGEVGFFKISRVDRIQDGVIRIEFKVGPKAVDYIRELEDTIEEAVSLLNTKKEDLIQALSKKISDLKDTKKKYAKLMSEINDLLLEEIRDKKITTKDGINIFYGLIHAENDKEMLDLAELLLKELDDGLVILGARIGEKARVVSLSKGRAKSVFHAGEIVREICSKLSGGGGGSKEKGIGGGPKGHELPRVIEEYVLRICEGS